MKRTFALLTILILAAPPLQATTCWPEEVYGGYSAIGCNQLFRQENYIIVYPDRWSAAVAVSGTGGCEQGSSCDPYINSQMALAGKTQCWPLFYSPSIANTTWSRKVQSRVADLQLKSCLPKPTLAGPVICNYYGTIRSWYVVHTCPGCHIPMP